MAVRVQLLGRFGLTSSSGEPLAAPSRKGQALIAVLALAGGAPVARERLTALLWSDRGEAQARGSLRQALTALRRAFDGIEPPPLIIDGDRVALDPEAVEVDTLGFAALAESPAAEDLERAAALYRGDLLDGLQVRDPAFEDWLEDERRGLRRRLGGVLRRLLALQADAGRPEPAIATAERLLGLDPLDEATHRALMRLYAGTGARNRALGQYKLCRETLERELGVAPEPATEELYEQIAQGRTVAEDAPAQAPDVTTEPPGALPLPDKPSIAVLPFENLSGDPAQDYFADALSDEITAALSRFRDLFVISWFSSLTYKGRTVTVQEVGRELGVGHVLKGSVQRSADRVRVKVGLVEAASGRQLWSERYDRRLEDVFALQDEVVGTIVSTLAGRLEEAGRERAVRKSEEELQTYDLVLRAEQCLHQGKKEDVLRARDLLEQAVERDPSLARAHVGLAFTFVAELYSDWTTEPERAAERALTLARKAVALDDLDSHAHLALAEAHLYGQSNFEQAEIEIEKARELNPNWYQTFCNKSWLLALTGRADEGIVCADQAFRLNPFAAYDCRMGQFAAAYSARRYEDALSALRSISNPGNEVHACLAACHAQLGLDRDAHQKMAEFLAAAREEIADHPGQDRERWRRYWARQFPFKDPADLDHLLDGLRKAGLPDAPPRPVSSAEPTVAVLPFENLSGDPEQAYFADGITEDIITGLSRFRDVAVIARTSSFAFKGQAAAVAEIAEKLGAQYIVEGSVRRAGGRVRITAQLIDAESGAHRWGQNYDRDLADIFAVQDEVTRTVVATLAGRISEAGVDRAKRKPTDNLTALDCLLQARDLIYRYSRAETAEAQGLLKRAIALDPGYAEAHAWLAETYHMEWYSVWSADAAGGQGRAVETIAAALELDDTDPAVHLEAAYICPFSRQYGQARYHLDRAGVLNPNQPDLAMVESFHAMFTGDHAGGLEKIQEAMRLDPFGRYGIPLGMAHYGFGQYEKALAAFRSVRAKLPIVMAWRAACHAQLDQGDDAEREAARFVEASSADMRESGAPPPGRWLDFLAARAPYERPEDAAHFAEGLRKAGLE